MCHTPSSAFERVFFIRSCLIHQLSNEDTGVRVYEMCVRALGVEEAWAHLRYLLEEIDAQRTADEQIQTLSSVAQIQDKVEWVEVFIIGVYAVELGHVLGEGLGLAHHDADFLWWYPGGTLLALAFLTILLAAYTLQLFHARSRIFWRRTTAFFLGVVLLVSHLAIGFRLKGKAAPAPNPGPQPTATEPADAATDEPQSH